MHAHDRTLLSKLGFADPDKKRPEHDWACQYLAQAETLARMLGHMVPEEQKARAKVAVVEPHVETHILKGEGQYRTSIGFADVTADIMLTTEESRLSVKPCYAEPAYQDVRTAVSRDPTVIEARAQYKQYNGTPRDEVTNAAWERIHESEKSAELAFQKQHKAAFEAALAAPAERKTLSHKTRGSLLVEVKIAPVSIGDAIRQLKLYREYWPVNHVGCGADHGGFLTCHRHVRNGYSDGCKEPHCSWSLWYDWGDGEVATHNRVMMAISTVLVTAYAVTDNDLDTLRREGIRHARLGAGFDAFCNNLRNASSSTTARIVEV